MKRNCSQRKNANEAWKDASTLHELYHEQDLTQREIADELGCGRSTVHRWMVRLGIDRRRRRVSYATFRTWESGHEKWQVRVGYSHETVAVHQLLAIAIGYDPEEVFDDSLHVHHKNEIPWDNRPENLVLMDATDHLQYHSPTGGA